jgi:hypothetical protein
MMARIQLKIASGKVTHADLTSLLHPVGEGGVDEAPGRGREQCFVKQHNKHAMMTVVPLPPFRKYWT